MKKGLLTKQELKSIEKIVNDLAEISQESMDKCVKECNYFGAWKNMLERDAFKTVLSQAELYFRNKWKL